MSANFTVVPRTSPFVAEMLGVDLTRPLSPEQIASIHENMDRYGVLVFRNQKFNNESQLAFTRQLGELEISAYAEMSKPEERRGKLELADASNIGKDNKPMATGDRERLSKLGNMLWHSDASFRAVPAKYSLLSARRLPSAGGNTELSDTRAAYDALDEKTKAEIADLITEHSLIFSREQIGFPPSAWGDDNKDKLIPVRHRLARHDEKTGRTALFLSAHIGGIVGWPIPEARMFLRDLMEFATQPRFVYAHEWQPHDLLMWDNGTTMHRARRYDDQKEIRELVRTTTRGTGMTAEQALTAKAS